MTRELVDMVGYHGEALGFLVLSTAFELQRNRRPFGKKEILFSNEKQDYCLLAKNHFHDVPVDVIFSLPGLVI